MTTTACRASGADGSWLTVPIVPGALQVFTGYLLTKDYLDVFGRPDQVSAWQEARPYVAAVVDARCEVRADLLAAVSADSVWIESNSA